jgi:hypothetical protein
MRLRYLGSRPVFNMHSTVTLHRYQPTSLSWEGLAYETPARCCELHKHGTLGLVGRC